MLVNIRLVSFITTLVVMLSPRVESQTYVMVYDHANYKGGSVALNNLDNYSYIYFTAFNDKTTSFKITTGSCVEMHMDTPPHYSSDNYWFVSISDISNVGSRYNDRISSVKACGKYSKTIKCPSGQFVKKISWDDSSSLRNGLQIRCYYPKSLSASSTYRSHGSSSLTKNAECTGIRGIRFYRNSGKLVNYGMEALCRQEQSSGYTYACPKNQALTEVRMDIENRSGYIKSASIICRDVGNIESICAAHDKLSVLFTCDASKAQYPFTCSHATTVGYGYSTSQSQEKRTERTFYEEFGYEIGAAGYGLSANFKHTLGTSQTTGYSWGTTQESTFQRAITITVEAEAHPGCVTKVIEIVGECSFMEARPYYFQRQDNCTGTVFVNDVFVPEKVGFSNELLASHQNLNDTRIVLSKIPENVVAYFEKLPKSE